MEERINAPDEQGTFTGPGGEEIHYYCWLPGGEVKAALVVVHGLAEHAGRYNNLINHFIPLGYAAYAIDHIGHGKSSGKRGFVERFEHYVDTLKTFRDMAAQWQGDKPLFMIGHSMGGLIGTIYLIEHPNGFNGAVFSGPAVKFSGSISPFTVTIGKVLSNIAPKLGLTQLDATGISRDKNVVDEYMNDPLVYHGKISARLGAELLRAMERVASEADRIITPIFVLQGGEDSLVSPEGARILYEKAGSEDKTLKIYDGLYHEIFNEPERDRVLRDVEDWLEKRLKNDRPRGEGL